MDLDTIATIVTLLVSFSGFAAFMDRKFNALRTELKADIGQVRIELKADIDQVRTDLKADIKSVDNRVFALAVGPRPLLAENETG